MYFPVSKRSIFEKSFKSYTNCFCRLTGALCYAIIIVGSTENVDRHIWGCSQAGKAPDFDSGMRRFESCHPCHDDKLIWIRARKNEKTGDFERFLPFFRPCIFSEFHRSLLPFSMLCPDSDSRKGLNLIVISLLRAFLARRYSSQS